MIVIKRQTSIFIVLIGVIFVALIAYGALTIQDRRSTMEKIGDAIHDLPQGADMAERQLEDRTPGQKLGDAVKDMGNNIKDNTRPSNSP